MAQGEEWRNGLCGHVCGGDCGTCMGAWFCSPCLFGLESSRLERFPDMSRENNEMCNAHCAGTWALSCFGVGWILAVLKRGELRQKFGIRGDGFKDCCATFWCTPCVLAQMNTELKDRAATPLMVDSEKMGYTAPQQGMVYGEPPQQQGTVYGGPPQQHGTVYEDPPQQVKGYGGPGQIS